MQRGSRGRKDEEKGEAKKRKGKTHLEDHKQEVSNGCCLSQKSERQKIETIIISSMNVEKPFQSPDSQDRLTLIIIVNVFINGGGLKSRCVYECASR